MMLMELLLDGGHDDDGNADGVSFSSGYPRIAMRSKPSESPVRPLSSFSLPDPRTRQRFRAPVLKNHSQGLAEDCLQKEPPKKRRGLRPSNEDCESLLKWLHGTPRTRKPFLASERDSHETWCALAGFTCSSAGMQAFFKKSS